MALAMHVMDDSTVDAEVKSRSNSARLRDIAYLVRRGANKHLEDDDVHVISRILMEAVDKKEAATHEYVTSALVARGRSKHKAEQLARALGV